MTAPEGFQTNNVGGGGSNTGGGGPPIMQQINLMVNAAAAAAAQARLQQVLAQGTNPAPAVRNIGFIQSAVSKLGSIFAAVFAVRIVKAWATEMYKAGTAVQETQAMYTTVFGPEGVKQMDTFLASFRKMAGMTTQEGQRWAAQAAAIGRGLGMTQAESLKMGKDILTMAGDLSAFWNTDMEQAFNAMRGGVTGMRRMLKDYGIVLYQVDVNKRALLNTGKESAKELTNEEKAQASLQLIQERMGAATGQLAREYNNVASAGRRASALYREMRDQIATRLLPGFAALFKALDASDGATRGLAYSVGTLLVGAFKQVLLIMGGFLLVQKTFEQMRVGAMEFNLWLNKNFGAGSQEDVAKWNKQLAQSRSNVKDLAAAIKALEAGYKGVGTPMPPIVRNVPFTQVPDAGGTGGGKPDVNADRDRIQVLSELLTQENEREGALQELADMETRLQETVNDTTVSMDKRADALRDLKRIEDIMSQDRRARVMDAEMEIEFDNTRMQGIVDLLTVEQELQAMLEQGNLSYKERARIQHELKSVRDAEIHALKLLANQYGITDEAMQQMWDGQWKAAVRSISKEARVNAMWNVAKAIEMFARSVGFMGLGNPVSSAASHASGVQHLVAAARWGALAGAAGAVGGSAAGGTGTAGDATGNNNGAVDTANGVRTPGVQVTVWVDGFDPSNPRHQDRVYAAAQDIRERYGENSFIDIKQWRKN